MTRGLLVVFTGANGSGKTSIINKLIEKMNSDIVINNKEKKNIKLWNVFKYPNRTTVLGKKIDDFLKKKNTLSIDIQLKFFADNRKECESEMLYLLNKGFNVICDRYVYCSIAYTMTNQTLSIKNNENIKILGIHNILKYDHGLIKPDHAFLIKGDFLSLRNEVAELYHKNGIYNDLLLNNYINALTYTKIGFTIIDNKFGELDITINNIINKLNEISLHKYNKGTLNKSIKTF